ncbi:MAG: trypsin-like peptidase domain-containing protein, partial [Eubacteriales bacterium]|nr:trypsin-like peptidase domain-containing protein [Eubacteriales bacterium]
MRERIRNLLKILFGIIVGAGVTYVIITNPFGEKTSSGVLGCKYTSCENKVIIDNTGISAAVSKVYDAVVMVENYKSNQLQGSGSGFVYKTDSKYGYIMTNQHVVENSTSLKVRMSNGEEVKANLLSGDDYLDIAVITIPLKSVINTVEIGESKDLKLGDSVFTIGSPVGEEYFNTVTSGIISGLNRQITVSINS